MMATDLPINRVDNTATDSLIMPSNQLVSSLLKRTQPDSVKADKMISDAWDKLRSQSPEVAHFISVNAYRQAPDDAELRENISSSMIQLYLLFNEASSQQKVFETMGDSLSKYFPLLKT
jgi:hypothetical protein